MTLHRKTLIVLTFTGFFLFLILSFLVKTTLLENFKKLEQKSIRENVYRAQQALLAEISKMHTLNKDWAWWDDTYMFIEDLNKSFAKSNIVPSTFITQRLNLLLFINKSGKIVTGKAFDLESEKYIEIREELLSHLEPGSPLLADRISKEGLSGILLLKEDILLISSVPILTSDNEGPVRGTLIFGRYLSTYEINRLARQVGLKISFSAQEIAKEINTPLVELGRGPIPTVKPLSGKIIAGYVQIMDIYNNRAVILKVEEKRSLYKQGLNAARIGQYSVLAVTVVFTVLILLLLQKTVLTPIKELSKNVRNIGLEAKISARLPYVGKSEIGTLTDTINKMLGKLEDSQEEREKLISDLQKALNEVKTLSGLLPICSSCKKIRDSKGYWNRIEAYIGKHSEVEFSHSLCEECTKKLYSNEDWYQEMKNDEEI